MSCFQRLNHAPGVSCRGLLLYPALCTRALYNFSTMPNSILSPQDLLRSTVTGSRQRLALAESLLLGPSGLTRTDLSKTLAFMHMRQIDDADLYFQSTCSESWSLEEGIVKTGSFSIDQGVGVRAVSGEKTAFAYSDDISLASLKDAARTVRTSEPLRCSGEAESRLMSLGLPTVNRSPKPTVALREFSHPLRKMCTTA